MHLLHQLLIQIKMDGECNKKGQICTELMVNKDTEFTVPFTKSSSFSVGRGIADVRPALRFVAAIVYMNFLYE